MDKPALGYTDFGKVKSPLALGFRVGKGWGGRGSMGVPSPRRGDKEGTGLELIEQASVLSSSVYTIWAIRGTLGRAST